MEKTLNREKKDMASAIRAQVRYILGLESDEGWEITDPKEPGKTHNNMVMVHYSKDFKTGQPIKPELSHIRGWLVDLNLQQVVASSYGYTPSYYTDKGVRIDDDANAYLELNQLSKFKMSELTLKPYFEGVMMRVVWHQNQMIRCTHKKIDPSGSRWGNSMNFLQMFIDAGAPSAEELFDTSKPYSSTCYNFLVVHQDLIVSTRQEVVKPFIVFVGTTENASKVPEDQVAKGIPSFKVRSEPLSAREEGPFIYQPKELSAAEANMFLAFGYHKTVFTEGEIRPGPFMGIEWPATHPYLLPGEALIVTHKGAPVKGPVKGPVLERSWRLMSPSISWRSMMRGEDPNIAHRFFTLITEMIPEQTDPKVRQMIKEKFFPCKSVSYPELKEMINDLLEKNDLKIEFLPAEEAEGILWSCVKGDGKSRGTPRYKARENRLGMAWVNYALSLPVHIQRELPDLLSQYQQQKEELTKWLQEIYQRSSTKEFPLKEGDRINDILSKSHLFSYNENDKKTPTDEQVFGKIANLVSKEHGDSLYRMHKQLSASRERHAKKLAKRASEKRDDSPTNDCEGNGQSCGEAVTE
jgi:hypothetical protein